MTFRRLKTSLLLVVAVTVVAACASSGNAKESAAGGGAGNCPSMPQDSLYAAGGPVYRECAVSTKARPLPTDARPNFTPASGGKDCYSAEVEFVIDANGYPETRTARVLRSNDNAFAESIMATLPQWRFEPATVDGTPVRQITTTRHTAQVRRVAVPSGSSPSAAAAAGRRPGIPKC